jgi:hypothetical protein
MIIDFKYKLPTTANIKHSWDVDLRGLGTLAQSNLYLDANTL